MTLSVGCNWEGWAKFCIWSRRGCTPPCHDRLIFQRWVDRLWDLPVCKGEKRVTQLVCKSELEW